MSSRSVNDNRFAARHRTGGRTPPLTNMYSRIDPVDRPIVRATARTDMPSRVRRQISAFSSTDM
jgi:hypothetical protein